MIPRKVYGENEWYWQLDSSETYFLSEDKKRLLILNPHTTDDFDEDIELVAEGNEDDSEGCSGATFDIADEMTIKELHNLVKKVDKAIKTKKMPIDDCIILKET